MRNKIVKGRVIGEIVIVGNEGVIKDLIEGSSLEEVMQDAETEAPESVSLLQSFKALFIVAATIYLSACGGGSATTPVASSAAATGNIKSALALAPQVASGFYIDNKTLMGIPAGATAPEKLSLNSDSATVSVSSLDDSSSYMVMGVSGVTTAPATVGADPVKCASVLARHSDGALFCGNTVPTCGATRCYNKTVQTDTAGLLYISGSLGLSKIDMSAPANPQITLLADVKSDGAIWDMAVNPDGDVFASLVTNDGANRTYKVFLASGGTQNISSSIQTSCLTPGVGADASNFYFVNSATNLDKIMKITKANGAFSTPTVYASGVNDNLSGPNCAISGSIYQTASRQFMAFQSTAGRNSFIELAPTTVKRWTVPSINQITSLSGYEGGIIILGQDAAGNQSINRFSLSDNTFRLSVATNSYSITSYSVSPKGEVTFSGRRLVDNSRIVGTVPATDGGVTVNTQDVLSDVFSMLRIN